MSQNKYFNFTIAFLGAVLGIIGNQIIFLYWFKPFLEAAATHGEPGCYEIAGIVVPILSDLGIIGGIVWLISAYGFITEKEWAFFIAVTGSVLSLQASFFPNIPAIVSNYIPAYFIIFVINLLLYFLLLLIPGKKTLSKTIYGFLICIAFIFCFMNGVASANRSMTYGWTVFMMTFRLHWIASLCFGITAVAFIVKPEKWSRFLCISAVLLELAIGIPLGIITALQLKRFSMFFLAPLVCILVLFLVCRKKVWEESV